MNPLELVFFILGMGFTEVIVKPLAIQTFRKAFSLLPMLFDSLDPVMPNYIKSMSAEEIEKAIYNAIEGEARVAQMKLSEGEKEALFKEFLSRYNPVTAAKKVGTH